MTQIYAVDFTDLGLWTQDPHNGSITPGTNVVIAVPNGQDADWSATVKLAPMMRIALADLGFTDLATLLLFDMTLKAVGGTLHNYNEVGSCLWQDDANFYATRAGTASITFSGWRAIANSFYSSGVTRTLAIPVRFQIAWNNSASSVVTDQGDTLTAGQFMCYGSEDDGSTWYALDTPRSVAITPTHFGLFIHNYTVQKYDVSATFGAGAAGTPLVTAPLLPTPAVPDPRIASNRRLLMDLYPPGAYPSIDGRNGQTFHYDLCDRDAELLAQAQAATEQLELEIFPQTAEETLDEWEAALQIDTVLTAVADRQGLAADAARSPLLVTPKNLRAMLAELLQSVYGFWDPGTFDVLAHYDVQNGLGVVGEGAAGLVAEGATPAALVWPGDDAHVSNRLVDRDDGFTFEAELQSATINAATATGLFLSPGPGGSGHGLFFGQEHFGGSTAIRALLYDADAGDWASLGSIATVGPPCWYRIVREGNLYHLRAGASLGALADVAVNVELPWRPRVWGVGSRSGGNTVGGLWQDIRIAYSLARNNVELHEYRADQIPDGDPERIFWAFVHRDPDDGGAYDLAGAQRICDRVKWGHSLIIVGESDCFLCDDPFSLTDRDILGA